MSNSFVFTSESVSEGHPDKLADQISDAVLDAIIAIDPRARVACETLVKTGVAIVAGEVTTSAWVDIEALVRSIECREFATMMLRRSRSADFRLKTPACTE